MGKERFHNADPATANPYAAIMHRRTVPASRTSKRRKADVSATSGTLRVLLHNEFFEAIPLSFFTAAYGGAI